MTFTRRRRSRISNLIMCAIFLSCAGMAQGKQPSKAEANPDEPAIHDYILTMDKVKMYADVARKAEAVAAADPSFAAEMKKVEDANVYNVQKAAMIENSPRLAAYFKTSGMTPRDFVLTPMSVFTAALAIAVEDAEKQPPNYVNPVNIKFVREHRDELEKLNLMGSGH